MGDGWIFCLSNLSYEKEITLQYLLHILTFKIHKQQKDFGEIHRLDFENDFKWKADESDHHRVCAQDE